MWLIVLLLIARATGAIFIFSGVSKIMARHRFAVTLRALPFLPSWGVSVAARVLPWVEILVGSALVVGLTLSVTAWIALALLLIFSTIAGVVSVRGFDVLCSCFGAMTQAPLSGKTIGRNLLISALLLPAAFNQWTSPASVDALLSDATRRSWFTIALLMAMPVCLAFVAVLIVTAQSTISRISPQ